MARIVDALASLRLAVATMVVLAVVCAWATVYESKHGTAAAQQLVYATPWFAALLALLGINILFSLAKRYPWKRHQVGFILAHVGILTLLAGSLVTLNYGLDSHMALYEGETSDRIALQEKALHVLPAAPSTPASFAVGFDTRPPRPGQEQRFVVPNSDLQLVAEDFLAAAAVTESFQPAPQGPPALHFVIQSPMAGNVDGWLMAGTERERMDLGPVSVVFRRAGTAAPVARASTVSFIQDPSGALSYQLATAGGNGPGGPVAIGQPIVTPWAGMAVSVDRYLPSAAVSRSLVAAPAGDAEHRSAVKVRIDAAGSRGASQWLLWGDSGEVSSPRGPVTVAYRAPQMAMPFAVSLLKFRSEKYPGSSMAASYESFVRIHDADRGVSEHHISMNHPLHYRGYVFFQSSFVEGQPMISILSVTRAPGLPLVYLGVTLVGAGVAWMFYLKPLLARRQGAAALAARGA